MLHKTVMLTLRVPETIQGTWLQYATRPLRTGLLLGLVTEPAVS